MRRSLVGAAFLLAVVLLFGCDSGPERSESHELGSRRSSPESGKVDTSSPAGPTRIPDLARPQKLDAPNDPAFEGWLDVGGISPTFLAIHPEGRSALVAVGYLSVLYDLESGRELRSWPERFSIASFSGNGNRLVTVGTNTVVRDGETGDQVCRIKSAKGSAIALSADGSRLAITNDSFDSRLARGVLIFDASSGRLHRAIPMPLATGFRSVAFVANGDGVLVGCDAWRHKRPGGQSPCSLPTNAIVNTQTGELVHALPDEATVCVSPNGRWIATGSAVKRGYPGHRPADSDTTTLTLWDAATGEPVQELKHDNDLRDFAFSPDSERILVSVGGRLVEWEWRSAERFCESDSKKPYARVYYSPDGRRRFALTEEPSGIDDDLVYRLRGWTIATGAELPIDDYEMSYNTIEQLFFFADGNRFVRFSQGQSTYAERDILSGEIVREPPMCRTEATGCIFMPEGERLLVARPRYFNDSLLTDLKSGAQRQWYLPGRGEVFLADGRLLFACNFKHLTLVDVVSNEIVWRHLLAESPTAAVMSPNGRHAVVATSYAYRDSERKRLVLLDTSKPSEIVVHNRHVTALSFHPQGDRFAEASVDSVFECEPTKGERTRLLFEAPGRTLDLRHSVDGKRVLACGVVRQEDLKEPITPGDDGWVALWDDSTGETIRLNGHEGPVTCAAFSPDGKRCVTGSLDKTIRVWDTRTGRLLHTFGGHLGGIKSVAWSPKENRILSAAEDGAAFWSVSGFAATPVESSPLATRFEVVEKVQTTNCTVYGIPAKPEGLVLPIPVDYQPPSLPMRKTEDWGIIELGKVKAVPPWDDHSPWLSLARSTVRYDEPLPATETARFGKRYALRGTTRNGSEVYASWIEKKAILCDETGKIVRTWDARISTESHVAINPNSEELVIAHESRLESGNYRYEIVVYDLETGEPKHTFLQDDGRELHGFHVCPTGSMFMLWLNGSRVLYDYQKGGIVNELPAPKAGRVLPSSISPDGRFLAVSALANVTLHDAMTLEPRTTLVNPFSVRCFQFSPDGKRLAVGQQSNLITMWDVDTAQPLWTRLGAGNWSSTRFLFSKDGRRFISRANSSLAVLWDAEAGDVLCVVRGPSDKVVLHPTGNSLRLGTAEGPMIWPEMEDPLQ